MPTFEERFRAVADWCAKNNFAAGYPNCHELTGQTPALYGTILFNQGITWQDVPRATLGNPADVRTRLSSAHDWAKQQGAGHGFPNFHEANYGAGIVYGTYKVDPATMQLQDIGVLSILGADIDPTTRPMEEWFRGAHTWATANGHVGAMPNGHYINKFGHWIIGIVSFNAPFVQWRDLTGDELGFSKSYNVGGGW